MLPLSKIKLMHQLPSAAVAETTYSHICSFIPLRLGESWLMLPMQNEFPLQCNAGVFMHTSKVVCVVPSAEQLPLLTRELRLRSHIASWCSSPTPQEELDSLKKGYSALIILKGRCVETCVRRVQPRLNQRLGELLL